MDEKINRLFFAMCQYDAGDPRRIQHFVKVHSFAMFIGYAEHLDNRVLEILEAAAVVHDCGIHVCEQKYDGQCGGSLQEKEGPAVARVLLENCGFTPEQVDRICYLVAHHHTYTAIDGADYRILVEADFLVNMYEDSLPDEAVRAALNSIFRTGTGKKLCAQMIQKAEKRKPGGTAEK